MSAEELTATQGLVLVVATCSDADGEGSGARVRRKPATVRAVALGLGFVPGQGSGLCVTASLEAQSTRSGLFVPVRIAASTPPGTHVLRLSLKFQACSDSECLPPETVQLTVSVVVNPPR
jgi:hypothetical protein